MLSRPSPQWTSPQWTRSQWTRSQPTRCSSLPPGSSLTCCPCTLQAEEGGCEWISRQQHEAALAQLHGAHAAQLATMQAQLQREAEASDRLRYEVQQLSEHRDKLGAEAGAHGQAISTSRAARGVSVGCCAHRHSMQAQPRL